MKQLITSVVIATLVSIMFVACSVVNKPATGEMKAALIQSIPGHFELNSFAIKASYYFGNRVEPIYISPFNSTVIVMVDLYKIDRTDKRMTFASLVTKRGYQTEVFGEITSRLYQGAWKHNIDIDGTPIHNLGVPLNQISAGRAIVSGSDDEKNYYAEIERKEKERQEAELRKNIANADKLLVGSWRDENSLCNYKSDRTLYCIFDNGSEEVQEWRINGDIINYTGKKFKKKNATWMLSIYKLECIITYIDKNLFTVKCGSNTYKARRVK